MAKQRQADEALDTLILRPEHVEQTGDRLSFRVPPGNTPLLCFVNPRSGGAQVYDMMESHPSDGKVAGPRRGLELFRNCPRLRVLVCGGDGTVGWVLDVMDKMGLGQRQIPVGFMPLGTGNDLSRSLNCGSGYGGTAVKKYLRRLLPDCYAPTKLDRWAVTAVPRDLPAAANAAAVSKGDRVLRYNGAELEIATELPQAVFNNYFSVGTDALIALRFHVRREANPERFKSRNKNKMVYGWIGAGGVLGRPMRHLSQQIELRCDGKDYTELLRKKGVSAVAFLNIGSYMAGCDVWGTKKACRSADKSQLAPPSLSDKLLEVVGMTSVSFVKAQSLGKIGLTHAIRICQCSEAVLTTYKPLPFQQDGEAVMLDGPCEITVSLKSQSTLLCKADKGRYKALLGKPCEYDTEYKQVDVMAIDAHDKTKAPKLVKQLLLPLSVRLAEARQGYLNKAVVTEFSNRAQRPLEWRYFERTSVAYRELPQHEESALAVLDVMGGSDAHELLVGVVSDESTTDDTDDTTDQVAVLAVGELAGADATASSKNQTNAEATPADSVKASRTSAYSMV